MSARRPTPAIPVDSGTPARVPEVAAKEGRPLPDLAEEPLADPVEARGQPPPRPHVMAAYRGSLEKYDELYEKLAK